MCQQNGVVVPSDVSDLLTQETTPSTAKSPRGVGVGGAGEEKATGLDELRQLLLSGRKKVTELLHVVMCTLFGFTFVKQILFFFYFRKL